MTIKGQSEYKSIIKNALNKMPNINKWQYYFIIEIIGLFLSIKGRINFMQLQRYGKYNEQHYRAQFDKDFDFLKFNIELVQQNAESEMIIAFDPSFISKSGKSTYGVGRYWSGVAGETKYGLEISGIAAVDIQNNTAFHLESIQTPNNLIKGTLLKYYTELLIERKEQLLKVSTIVVADAYFSKDYFVNQLFENGFNVISRFRHDVRLQYRFIGTQKKGRGRPRKFAGLVDKENLDMNHFKIVFQSNNTQIYNTVVYATALKRFVNLVLVRTKRKNKWSRKLYFSTDLELSYELILKYYQSRFQIEFVYRDGKQFTGLHQCQARSESKLHFHHNISLSTVNIAKIAHWISAPKTQRKAFSLSSIKTVYHNELLLNGFISTFGISSNTRKNKQRINELLKFGAIAA
jgi:hypothetical protein